MQRHLSTGSHMLSVLMESHRNAAPQQGRADPLHDVVQLLLQQEQDDGRPTGADHALPN